MKKIFYIPFIIAGLLASTTSCSDSLDNYSPGILDEATAFQTSGDLKLLLNSCYSSLDSRTESVFVSTFTDEIGIGYANGGQGITDSYVFNLNPGSGGPTAFWQTPYLALNRINRVLILADKISPVDQADADLIASIKAQALTLRAYCHLFVLSYFTTDMTDDSALAGIISDRIFDADVNDFPRNTNGEFYAFIHNDLQNAIDLYNGITTSTVNITDINYANIYFAKGLRARAYAYKGDYINAAIWANDVINTSSIGLADKPQYRRLFFNDTQNSGTEVIFRIDRISFDNAQGYNLHNGWCSVTPDINGSPFYEVSRALHNKLNPTNLPAASLASGVADVRANMIIGPSSLVNPGYATSNTYRTDDVLIINKHGGTPSATVAPAATAASNSFTNDIKIMRISEMYMIRAEAYAKAMNFPGVASEIAAIRSARFGAPQIVAAPGSLQAAWKMILDERRIEFAFEGYRFLDLKRFGALANSGIDRDPADYASSTSNYPGGNPANLPLTSHKWALPIPTTETNVNTLIQQNPGY